MYERNRDKNFKDKVSVENYVEIKWSTGFKCNKGSRKKYQKGTDGLYKYKYFFNLGRLCVKVKKIDQFALKSFDYLGAP